MWNAQKMSLIEVTFNREDDWQIANSLGSLNKIHLVNLNQSDSARFNSLYLKRVK